MRKSGAHLSTTNLDVRKNGFSFLQQALHANSLEIVQLLIGIGADVNIQETKFLRSPLHFAVMLNVDTKILQALIHAGADVNVRDIFKRTPLQSKL